MWVDGIHVNIRLDEHQLCLLVMIGVRADDRKELVALTDGYRESTESWADLLRDCARRGIRAPVLAVGDGALGFWGALRQVFPQTREQRRWFHKIANVLGALPKSAHPGAKKTLAEISAGTRRAPAGQPRRRHQPVPIVQHAQGGEQKRRLTEKARSEPSIPRIGKIESGNGLEALVAAAIAGDRGAIGRVLATIRPLVVRYCRARLGRMDRSSVSADDVAQEVCLAVLTALPGYRVQARPFLAFVYGVAAHKVIDAHRAATRNRSEPVADVPDSVEVADGPEQRALRVELSSEIDPLLDTLPEKQREILVLRVAVGLSAEEDGRRDRIYPPRRPGRTTPGIVPAPQIDARGGDLRTWPA